MMVEETEWSETLAHEIQTPANHPTERTQHSKHIYLSVYLSIYLSVCLPACPPACLSVCLSIYLSICLSICPLPPDGYSWHSICYHFSQSVH